MCGLVAGLDGMCMPSSGHCADYGLWEYGLHWVMCAHGTHLVPLLLHVGRCVRHLGIATAGQPLAPGLGIGRPVAVCLAAALPTMEAASLSDLGTTCCHTSTW